MSSRSWRPSEPASWDRPLPTLRPCGRAERRASHPVTPIIAAGGLFVFMEPTSPKGRDLRERGWFALHNGVPDTEGSGGEFFVSGKGELEGDAGVRATVSRDASYDPAERYILFELKATEARCNGYGDVTLPARRRWSSAT